MSAEFPRQCSSRIGKVRNGRIYRRRVDSDEARGVAGRDGGGGWEQTGVGDERILSQGGPVGFGMATGVDAAGRRTASHVRGARRRQRRRH